MRQIRASFLLRAGSFISVPRSPSRSLALVAALMLAACGNGEIAGGIDDDVEEIAGECPEEVTTDSGLTYEDLDCGDGEEAAAGDTLIVHYTGTLEDGTQFDSSLDRGEPFEFVLGAGMVIRGWDEGLQGVQEGGSRRLEIPPELAYGEEGAPPAIPANATLVFEVDLLEVVRD